MALADDNVSTAFAGRFEQAKRNSLCHDDNEQCSNRMRGVGQPFELHDRAPAFLRCARDEVIELSGGMGQPQLAQLITQRRRDRVE